MIDWRAAVRAQYGIEPTAEAIRVACGKWGWSCEFVVDPVQGAMICSITIPTADGDHEQLGIGASMDEAAGRALVQIPHDRPVV